MSESFSFIEVESSNAFDKLIKLAEENTSAEGFLGELSSQLYESLRQSNRQPLLSLLDENLYAVKREQDLNLKLAWDGGINNFSDENTVLRLEWFSIFLCIYLRELSFRKDYKITQANSFYNLIKFVNNNRHEFSDESSYYFNLYDELPILIMREIYHSSHMTAVFSILEAADINQVEEFIRTKDESISKIEIWNTEFTSKQTAVNTLKEKLDKYKTAFNFVGLYQGFLGLKETKDDELKSLNRQYYIFMIFLIFIPVYELYFVYDNINSLDINKIGFIIFPSITLLLILFWFLRIVLHNIRSIKSQLMQLELRMTLCQFIQSYAESSKELKENNKEGFEKFENLIFSSIVSSDEKIPATFDGMEQITSLLKILNK